MDYTCKNCGEVISYDEVKYLDGLCILCEDISFLEDLRRAAEYEEGL